MANSGKVLVLGATVGIGGETARQLRDAGWDVYALKRGAEKSVEHKDGVTWVRGTRSRGRTSLRRRAVAR